MIFKKCLIFVKFISLGVSLNDNDDVARFIKNIFMKILWKLKYSERENLHASFNMQEIFVVIAFDLCILLYIDYI